MCQCKFIYSYDRVLSTSKCPRIPLKSLETFSSVTVLDVSVSFFYLCYFSWCLVEVCSNTNSAVWLTGAPGCINDSLLTGLQFVEGFESFFFVSRWTMHQLVIPEIEYLPQVLDLKLKPVTYPCHVNYLSWWNHPSNLKHNQFVVLPKVVIRSIGIIVKCQRIVFGWSYSLSG